VKGSKRHIVSNLLKKRLLHVKVHAANTHDTVAGCCFFEENLKKYPSLKGVCADASYRKTMEEFVKKILKKTIEISARITPGSAIIAKIWVVREDFCLVRALWKII
jgi:hypothetical protein